MESSDSGAFDSIVSVLAPFNPRCGGRQGKGEQRDLVLLIDLELAGGSCCEHECGALQGHLLLPIGAARRFLPSKLVWSSVNLGVLCVALKSYLTSSYLLFATSLSKCSKKIFQHSCVSIVCFQ